MLGQDVAPRADRSWAVVEGRDGGREHHFRADGVKREFEPNDNPKIAAPALERPEQVRVLIVTGPNKPAICRDHICRDQIVDRKSVPGAQPSDPAGQGQPGHATPRDETPGRRKPMRLPRLVDIAPQGATFNHSNARLRSEEHTSELQSLMRT